MLILLAQIVYVHQYIGRTCCLCLRTVPPLILRSDARLKKCCSPPVNPVHGPTLKLRRFDSTRLVFSHPVFHVIISYLVFHVILSSMSPCHHLSRLSLHFPPLYSPLLSSLSALPCDDLSVLSTREDDY